MIEFILKAWGKLTNMETDPRRSCAVYKEGGCAYVGSYLCNMKTCTLLATDEIEKEKAARKETNG